MSDILMIGGGIMGMLSARFLSKQGATVTLLEKGQLGCESSWAGGGIISPLYPWRYTKPVTDLATIGQQQYPALIQQLIENTGIDPEYQRSGLMIIAPDEETDALNWAEEYQQVMKLIDLAEMQSLEPTRIFNQQSAIWMKDIGQVRNPRLVKSLSADIRKRGVKVFENTSVEQFKINQKTNNIEGVYSQKEYYQADKMVVCSGAWSANLLKKTNLNIDVKPILGQMICFKGHPDQVSRIILENDRYIIPRRDGRILFGSTLEDVGFNKQITNDAKSTLKTIAIKAHPILKTMPVEYHWSGLRPATHNSIPYIGQHPIYHNLYFNCGQYRNGVVIGLASCQLLSQMVSNQAPIINPIPYAVD